jgi:hypothetical protein
MKHFNFILFWVILFFFSSKVNGIISAVNLNKRVDVFEGEKIQAAINKASAGDTIIVHDGIYHETININKPVVLMAKSGGEAMITNKYAGQQKWRELPAGSNKWVLEDIEWPVHWLLVDGIHAFDYRNKINFDRQQCGPFWSKGWQDGKTAYTNPPLYFAYDSAQNQLWLKLKDSQNPNDLSIDFNSHRLDDTTLVQKDLGTYWNQQEIVTISKEPPIHPITMWYGGSPQKPAKGKVIDFPKICGIIIDVNADSVTVEGFRIHLAPTVGIEINNSKNVTVKDCYFSGYQFGINTGYECTHLTVVNCEFDGGELVSTGKHSSVNLNMWNHSTYVIPVKFNGTGLTFHHNYVYEGYDLFQPRGCHKKYPHVPGLMSDIAYNVWQQAIDNNLEFDGIEATISMRFHHNLVLGRGGNDMLAITTTENGNPLMIDHNLFWSRGDDNRIMKLIGTRRRNDGVLFIHNTYLTGSKCSTAPFGNNCAFENNILVSGCTDRRCWNYLVLNSFMPNKYNLCQNGDEYISTFRGITEKPLLGNTPSTFFCLQPGSPAIDAGILRKQYYHNGFTGKAPDLGALESTDDIDNWRRDFKNCGPSWINAANEDKKAPHRPKWPEKLDKKWGGLN